MIPKIIWNTLKYPKRELEHIAIAEYLLKLGITKETPGRMFSIDESYGILRRCVTPIRDQSETENYARWAELTKTADDVILSGIADDIFGSQPTNSNDDSPNDMDCNMTTLDLRAFMEEGNGDDDANGEDNIDDDDNNSIEEDIVVEDENGEVEFHIGSNRRITGRRANVNERGFCDIVTVADAELKVEGLETKRLRHKERLEREFEQRKEVYGKTLLFTTVATAATGWESPCYSSRVSSRYLVISRTVHEKDGVARLSNVLCAS